MRKSLKIFASLFDRVKIVHLLLGLLLVHLLFVYHLKFISLLLLQGAFVV